MTVSELLAVPGSGVADSEGAGARARVRATESVTDGDASGVSWVERVAGTVTADLRGAWLWDAHGPSPRALWDARIPDRDAVPGANKALWLGWVVYNHAALAVLVPLMFAFWVAAHPARLLYAAPIAAGLITLWLV